MSVKRRYHRLMYRLLLWIFQRSYRVHLWAWYKLLRGYWKPLSGKTDRRVV